MTTHPKAQALSVLLSASIVSIALLSSCSQADATPSASSDAALTASRSPQGTAPADSVLAEPALTEPDVSVEAIHSIQATGLVLPGLIGAAPVTGIEVEIRYESDADSELGADEQQGSPAGENSDSKTTVQQPLTKSPKTIK